MKKLLPLVASVFLILGFFFYEGEPEVFNSDVPIVEMVFFGDSLTRGYGIANQEQTFAAQVASSFAVPYKNFGVNGDTTASGLKRISQLTSLKKGTLVLVTLGGNDILHRKDLKETVNNLRAIFSFLQERHCTVAFTEVLTPIPLTSRRHKAYKKLCEEAKVFFIDDIMDGLWHEGSLMHDKVHPNAAGAKIISERIIAQLLARGFEVNEEI